MKSTNKPRIKGFFGVKGRPNDGAESQLNAAEQDFVPYGNQRCDGSRSPSRRNGRFGSSNLNAKRHMPGASVLILSHRQNSPTKQQNSSIETKVLVREFKVRVFFKAKCPFD